jgi:hypothetical protein
VEEPVIISTPPKLKQIIKSIIPATPEKYFLGTVGTEITMGKRKIPSSVRLSVGSID